MAGDCLLVRAFAALQLSCCRMAVLARINLKLSAGKRLIGSKALDFGSPKPPGYITNGTGEGVNSIHEQDTVPHLQSNGIRRKAGCGLGCLQQAWRDAAKAIVEDAVPPFPCKVGCLPKLPWQGNRAAGEVVAGCKDHGLVLRESVGFV
jgi:hypothetical protein